MALLMRIQLGQAEQEIVTRDGYNQLFTIHGTTMVFLFVVPIPRWPGTIAARDRGADMAFPRLNALSYWLFLLGGLVVIASFWVDGGAASSAGLPSAALGPDYSPTVGQDLWILGIHLTSIGSLAGAINFIVTIHNMRTRGMTWLRIPLFVWSIEAYAVLLVLALPAISAAMTLLLLDRQAGTAFFQPADGGSQVLYQHMFWFFGHPEVYTMVLRRTDALEIILVFSRKPIFGYRAVAFSTIGIAFASMLVWAHHMFTVGLPIWLNAFFLVSSLTVAIPTAVKIFNWLATLWRGKLDSGRRSHCLGFIGLFTIGGLWGSSSRCSRSTTRRTTRTTSSRTSTTSSSEARSSCSPGRTTGSRRSRAGCTTNGSARRASGSSSSASTRVPPTAHARSHGHEPPRLHVQRLRRRALRGVQPHVHDRDVDHDARAARLHREHGEELAGGSGSAPIPGAPTRSSGTPPRRRRRTTSTAYPSCRATVRSGTCD